MLDPATSDHAVDVSIGMLMRVYGIYIEIVLLALSSSKWYEFVQEQEARVRACNSVNLKAVGIIQPLLKIVTHAQQGYVQTLAIVAKHILGVLF